MTDIKEQIVNLLKRRQEIDEAKAGAEVGSFTANHRWLIDAVKILLKSELERQ